MKMKIVLVIIMVLAGTSSIFAQTLLNTTWAVNDNNNNFYYYFHFGNDTLSRSTDNVTYVDVSTFQENGYDFSILDLIPSACITDTGIYTLLVENDTLTFFLVEDSCPTGRYNVLTNFHWTSFVTAVPSIIPSVGINLFPNPAVNGIVNLKIENNKKLNCTISIFNINGQKVFMDNFRSSSTNLNLHDIFPGIYFVQVSDGTNQFSKKLIVQ